MLEVLDHFRPNLEVESRLELVVIDGFSITDEEPAGLVPDRWLSPQHLGRGVMLPGTRFVDLGRPEVQAALNDHPGVRAALAESGLGAAARVDGSTIRLAGSVGRPITQAISRAIYDDPSDFTGICYRTRFDDSEDCWAVFDDRAFVSFDPDQPLSLLDPFHRTALHAVAALYGLTLPPNWQ